MIRSLMITLSFRKDTNKFNTTYGLLFSSGLLIWTHTLMNKWCITRVIAPLPLNLDPEGTVSLSFSEILPLYHYSFNILTVETENRVWKRRKRSEHTVFPYDVNETFVKRGFVTLLGFVLSWTRAVPGVTLYLEQPTSCYPVRST